ncbi:MAG: BamA/TamA family outer membrane protein [Bdellovibrionales bacterium]
MRAVATKFLAEFAKFLLFAGASLSHADVEICPKLVLKEDISPPLTDTEKQLICGNPGAANTEFQAWTRVPLSQATLHLKAFLQTRGYLNPRFDTRDDRLHVQPGAKVEVKDLALENPEKAPEDFDVTKKRDVAGRTLTPELLSEVEDWSARELQNQGYACATATALAAADSGQILLRVEPGERYDFGAITMEPLSKFAPEAALRGYAFRPGQKYDLRLVRVTENRLVSTGLLEHAKLVPDCSTNTHEIPVRQFHEVGGSRLLTASLSADTEHILQGRAQWMYTHIGHNASQAAVGLSASARRQEADLRYEWYFAKPADSHALVPRIIAAQHMEDPYRLWTERGMLLYRTRWDTHSRFAHEFSIGPQFEMWQVKRSRVGEWDSEAASLRAEYEIHSLDYELYEKTLPRGTRARVLATAASDDLLADFTAQTFALEGVQIWNYKSYSPPLLMIALRGGLRSTIVPEEFESHLPPTYRAYLGGHETVRGFSRMELPVEGEGALSAAYAGVELRPDWITETIHPIFFVDAGLLGRDAFSFASPVYWSPGLGITWRSPLGPVKSYLAHGFVAGEESATWNADEHWQFYLSLGETF